jgi:hypothetical protein
MELVLGKTRSFRDGDRRNADVVYIEGKRNSSEAYIINSSSGDLKQHPLLFCVFII